MTRIRLAYECISARLKNGGWQQGERLPPLSELAKLCDVSRSTMWKAVALLKKESLIFARQGGAMVVGNEKDRAPVTSQRMLLWEQIKSRIGREVILGSLGLGRLPPTGKMALRYAVDYRTLRKALEGLAREGFLVPEGRRYAVSRHRPMSVRPAVVLISGGNGDERFTPIDPRTQSLTQSFEREAPRVGFECQLEFFEHRNSKCLLEMSSTLRKVEQIAGIILNIWYPWDDTLRRRWLDLLRLCVLRRIPVVVIDQSGDMQLPDMLRRSELLRMIRCSDYRAGEMVADALVRRGHRHIAFITPFTDSEWTQARCAGLRRYCDQFGARGTTVDFFEPPVKVILNDMRAALLKFDEREMRTLLRANFSENEILGFLGGVRQFQATNPAEDSAISLRADTLRFLAQSLKKLADRVHDSQVYAQVLDLLLHLSGRTSHAAYLHPLFTRVLKSCPATAWVCSEDKTATAALSFLRSAGVKVPETISLFGFDNWYETYSPELSTFDFNMNGMIQEALLMILDQDYLKSKPAISKVDGYVVERRTTRK